MHQVFWSKRHAYAYSDDETLMASLRWRGERCLVSLYRLDPCPTDEDDELLLRVLIAQTFGDIALTDGSYRAEVSLIHRGGYKYRFTLSGNSWSGPSFYLRKIRETHL